MKIPTVAATIVNFKTQNPLSLALLMPVHTYKYITVIFTVFFFMTLSKHKRIRADNCLFAPHETPRQQPGANEKRG
jgi:hypothetical protein